MSLVINNKVVKSKKGFTTLIKREGISSVNDMSLWFSSKDEILKIKKLINEDIKNTEK